MRTFSCFTSAPHDEAPTLSFVLAASLERARELARKELMERHNAVSVEIVEGGQLLDVLLSDSLSLNGRPQGPKRLVRDR